MAVLQAILLTLVTFPLTYCLWTYWTSPVRSFPGHWASSFSNIWRFLDVFSQKHHETLINLHEKHGHVVRMGPNIVSVTDPVALKEVCRLRNPWLKTQFYAPNDVMAGGTRISNVFGTRDEAWHDKVIRPIKGLYGLTRAMDMEPHIDVTIAEWFDALDQRFATGKNAGKAFDAADWVPYFAYDSMSRQTFGKPYGLIEAGNDKDMIKTSTEAVTYFASVSQIPTLDLFLEKNPYYSIGPKGFGWAVMPAYQALHQRLAEPTQAAYSRQSDYLDKFLEIKKNNDFVDDNMVVGYLLVNILAGSDTTAVLMCAAVYYILKTPAVYKKLVSELQAAHLDQGPVSMKEAQKLPYLDACLKEASRMHPPVGLLLERYVPDGGYTLPDGRFLPAGSVVGFNAWACNRVESVFGAKVHDFIPERWLQQEGESETAFVARRREMENAEMSFGAGKRVCTGKPVAVLTAMKLLASLFNRYEVSLVDPSKDWTFKNVWFTFQDDINITIKPRAVASNGVSANGYANGSTNGHA